MLFPEEGFVLRRTARLSFRYTTPTINVLGILRGRFNLECGSGVRSTLEILKAAVNFISVFHDMDDGMADLRSSQEEIVVARESLMASQAKLAIAQDKLNSARERLKELTGD